jgi:transposase-like protein
VKRIKRQSQAVGILPDDASIARLVGALLGEQTDEWQVGRRDMRLTAITGVLPGIESPVAIEHDVA